MNTRTALRTTLLTFALIFSGASIAAGQNPDIAKVQHLLADLGYEPGEADGHMGNNTRRAIALFQEDFELTETGEIDSKTLQQLATSHQKMIKRRKQQPQPALYAFFADKAPKKPAAPSDKKVDIDADDESLAEQEDDAADEPEREFSLLAVTQEQLDELGYDPGNFEGDMTEDTRDALKDFQEDNDLPVTGVPDNATNNALNREMKQLKREQVAAQKAAGNDD